MGNAIIFDDDNDNSYCDKCDYLLYERKDNSMICSNPGCGREYLPDSVNKHHRKLGPNKNANQTDGGPELISLTGYARPQKKKETVPDKEERLMASKKSGFSWTNIEEWLPE